LSYATYLHSLFELVGIIVIELVGIIVNTPPAKPGDFGLRLKIGLIGHLTD
jgi:hypothetical protein